jgi:predicted metal-dependent phosphoesterase TrpH
MKKFDLHTHTTCSDGSYTPEKLFEAAKNCGLSGVSITDHDTVDAYFHMPKTDLRIGVGVEFSAFLNEDSVHILGYDFIFDHHVIKDFCLKHKNRRFHRNLAIIKKLQNLGFNITESDLYTRFDDRTVGRPHIAQLLIEAGICKSMEHAFKDYLAEGKKAFASGEKFSVQETIEVIKKADGKAFIAHPQLIKKRHVLRELQKMPFDGIEVFYAKYPKKDTVTWEKLAHEKKWLMSGGSDFHGELKTFNQLGSSWVNEELFNLIFKRPIVSDY